MVKEVTKITAVPSRVTSRPYEPPVAASQQLRDVLRLAKRAAANDIKVFITGETGVGKDVVAAYIHHNSARCRAQYVAVNCAGVTESLLESELFGHMKGSFTGAFRDKVGKLLLAHGGSLFLDEVAEMSLRMQGLLLRFLENGEIQPVGSDAVRRVDVRVIAATNRDLTELVRSGRFREDLLYRLRVIHIHVPPLRERPDDIRPIAKHFIAASNHSLTMTEDAWKALERHQWPGNVRELRNVIEQCVWRSTEERPITEQQLPPTISAARPAILPARERRRQVADDLYEAIVTGGYSFWDHIHPLLMHRDITRHDMRQLVRRGLGTARGNYRALLQLFGLPPEDYKRFMNFLAAHDCQAEFREFRNGSADPIVAPRAWPPVLPPLSQRAVPGEPVGDRSAQEVA